MGENDVAATAWDVQGTIGQLWVFPVKSCAGLRVEVARLLATGLEHDREWMVVDAAGEFLTQRSHPAMALVRPALRPLPEGGVQLWLQAPGMVDLAVSPPAVPQPRQVRVWKDRVAAHDMGAEAAAWLSQFLQTPCQLVRFDAAQPRDVSGRWTQGVPAQTQFADGYPVLVTSTAAEGELNGRLQAAGAEAVTLERFRANVVLDGVEAHEEDWLDELQLLAADGTPAATLRMVKPCTRCPIPDIDPATAVSSPTVSTALQTYRADARMDGAITFGMNAIVLAGAGQLLRVGQAVGAQLEFA